jgi:cytochrome c biogenesis protein CcmG, thiol:disulfide interchange protein DsbE
MQTGTRMRTRLFRIVVVLAAAGLAYAAMNEPELPSFVPTGVAAALPAEGDFGPASLEEFSSVLVGQRGTPVVVNVWASWCAPCRTEMPLLQAAADDYAGRVVIVGVASKDAADDAGQFLADNNITFPNVFDESGDIRRALELTAYPTTYVFGADGTIRARVNGGISEQRLAALIDAAIAADEGRADD